MDKKNTEQKKIKQQPHKKDRFPLIAKNNLTDKRNLSGPQPNGSKYTINQNFTFHDPLDTISHQSQKLILFFSHQQKKIHLKF